MSKEKLKKPMEKLMAVIEERGFRWLAFEMKADIKAEKEQLQIEEYVYRETGIMVHSQFGKCARISEVDKKDIQLMMSWRYQVAKEAWREQLEACEKDKEVLEEYKAESEGKMKVFYDMLLRFLQSNEGKLGPHAGKLLKKMTEESDNNVGDVGKPKRDHSDMLSEAFDEFVVMLDKTADKRRS